MPLSKKRKTTIILLVALISYLVLWTTVSKLDFSDPDRPVTFGVTFSHKYTSDVLGLNWTEVYWDIINDLNVKHIRLVAHWDKIEEGDNEYNFNDLEWMIDQTDGKDINIILAIGRRTPRWPECHDPAWIKDLPKSDQDQQLLDMLQKTVKHFKKYNNIIAWQVENEPFLKTFGECPKPDIELLKQEIALVRSLDSRPIIITDSGELSNWTQAASLADIFGTTMYKSVWAKFIGAWRYPLPPVFYHYKSNNIQKKYFNIKKIIVSELQAEPWVEGGGDITITSLHDQYNSFNLNDFKNNLEYAKQAGFTEVYLWGVEWWYWLKTEQGRPEFWNMAKSIWQD